MIMDMNIINQRVMGNQIILESVLTVCLFWTKLD